MTGRRSLDELKRPTNKETLPQPRFSQRCSIRSVTADRDPSRLGQLECNRRCGDWSAARANRTTPLDGVALSARNSHQINTRLQHLCRAADDNRQRYLAKECVGSNRGRQERSQLPAATTTELNPIRSVHRQTKTHANTEKGENAQRYPYAATLMETALA
jgi:hypothetical protein